MTNPAAEPAPAPQAPKRAVSRKRRILFISIPYLLFMLMIAGVEIGVRLTRPHVSSIQVFIAAVDDTLIGQSDRNQMAGGFEGDPRLSWKMRPNLKDVRLDFTTFSTNAQGLRYPRDIGAKPSDGLRVLCFGDSVSFGYRVPTTFPDAPKAYDASHQPYAWVMEEHLKQLNPGREVEVIPMACSGYSSHQGLAWMKRDLPRYKPDVVTILYGYNDTTLRPLPDAETIPTSPLLVFQRWLMMRSQAMIHFTRWREARRAESARASGGAPAPVAKPRVSEEDYVANILEMARFAREHGASVALIAPVYENRLEFVDVASRFASYHHALMKAAKEADIPILDMRELTPDGHPFNTPLFSEVIHPHYSGHWRMANELLYFLDEKKLLGDFKGAP